MNYVILEHQPTTNLFDKHEGCLRTEYKLYDRTIHYKGFEIFRNSNVPQGADGRWDVPKLKWWGKGGLQIGFLTVSITQAKEAIDKYLEYNIS